MKDFSALKPVGMKQFFSLLLLPRLDSILYLYYFRYIRIYVCVVDTEMYKIAFMLWRFTFTHTQPEDVSNLICVCAKKCVRKKLCELKNTKYIK